jgi:P27 family predicted phage terminase small subunit
MPRGRPRKPTRLKILDGNPGKRPLNAAEPQPPAGAPACPSWLDREAKAEWRRVVPALDRLGLLTRVDRSAIAGYCTAWAELCWASKTLARVGHTYTTEGGQICPRPEVAMHRSALRHVRQFSALFGLDPASRSRVEVPDRVGPRGEVEELDHFLGNGS